MKNGTFSRTKNQFIAVLCGNLSTMSIGCALGWISPALQTLKSDDTPFETGPLTVDEISWIGSIQQLTGLVAFPMYVLLLNYIGRKVTVASLIVPLIINWILIIFATNVIYLYISRFAMGIVVGGVFLCIPLMVAEIADDDVRGILGAMFATSQYFGILLSYIIGAFVPYSYVPYILLPIPVLFFLTFIFLPESPMFLIKTNKRKEAENSLKFYKNCQGNTKEDLDRFDKEMEKLLSFNEKISNVDNKFTIKDFVNPMALRALGIGAFMMYIYGFCGFSVLFIYGAMIFEDTGSDFDANISTIIMGAVQLLGTLSAFFLIDKFGRKILYVISTFGATIGFLCVGIYTYLNENGYELNDGLSWIPVVTVSLALYSICIGVVPVTIIVIAEILPGKIRSVGSMINMLMMSISLFSTAKIFPIITDAAGLHVTLWIFTANNFIGLLFGIFVLKETKGKKINI